MTQSPANLVPRVLGLPIVSIAPIASFLALSKLSENQETLRHESDSPASFDSIS